MTEWRVWGEKRCRGSDTIEVWEYKQMDQANGNMEVPFTEMGKNMDQSL